MKQYLKWIVIVGVVVLAAIAIALSQNKNPAQAPAPLSIQITPSPQGPQVIAQDPIAGQRLALSPVIKITFDRTMDHTKTGGAFSLRSPDGSSVPGKVTWLDAQSLQFAPDQPLAPSTKYAGVVSTSAAGTDGLSPADAITLDFTTVESLEVAQVFPAADAEDVDQTTTITVIFNHPVVPLATLEDQAVLPQPIELSPPVAGKGRWLNTSVYVFEPEPALVGGIRYTVRVGAGLKDIDGNTLKSSFVSQFTTRAPGIETFLIKNGPSNPPLDNVQNILLDQAFVVTFYQPMNQKAAAAALAITNQETHTPVPLTLTWNDDSTVLIIVPRGRYAIASVYDLVLGTDAQATDGSKLKDALKVHFSTVPMPQVVKITTPDNSKAKGFDNSLTIQFASPMRVDSLKGKVVITPPPKGASDWYYSDYDWTYHMYGLDPGTDYVVRLLPGMADIYGNTIRTGSAVSFTTADMPPYAQLIVPWTPLVYRAHGPQEVYFEYRNVDSPSVSLYPLSFADFTTVLKKDDKTTFNPQVQPLRTWTADIAPKNQLGRLLIKLQDQKGNALPAGYYLLGVKGNGLDYKGTFFQAGLFVVATDNITFKATSSEGLAWVVDLESGRPQADVPVTFYDKDFSQVGKTVATDANGLVYLKDIQSPMYARVEGSGHLAFVATDWGSGVWAGDKGIQQNYYGNTTPPFVYLYTDRPVYRPGQDVYFKGLLRLNDDLHYSLLEDSTVHVVIDQEGEQVYSKDLTLSALGSINDDFKLSADAALGTYTISVTQTGAKDPFGSLTFRVAEYHKPTFQVAASSEKPDVLLGDPLDFRLDAAYYSGGNVGGAQVNWFTEAAPYSFTPDPKYSQFSFMDWDRDVYYQSPEQAGQAGTLAEGKAATDANGHLDLPQTASLGEAKTDQQVTFHANVTDVAGDAVSGQTSVVVHQSLLYAGVRAMSYVGTQGKEQPFEIVVLDWDSQPVANQRVTVQFVQRQWFSVQKQDQQGQLSWVTSVKDVRVGQKSVTTGSDGTAQVSFVPAAGGVYKAIVIVTDIKGRKQQSSAYTWVSSDQYIPWRQTNDRSFNLIADKDMYSPGDTAELLIAQPFQGSVYALVTYERGHIYKQDVILLNGNSTVYKLLITDDMAPMAYVSVVVVSGADNSKTPDFKVGMARLNIDPRQRGLDVKITTDKPTAGPGESVTYTVTTRDQSGKPVSADVSLAVVDKGALALAPSNSGRILDSFYPMQALGVQTSLGLVANAEDFNAQYRESIPQGGGSGGGGGETSYGIITLRQDFKDTAFFQAQLTTDKDGQAQVSVKLPENLTTWVADARAATADGHVGQGTDELVSTKPLFVDMQTPRFFVAGDSARVGAAVHNNSKQPLPVEVSLDATGVQVNSPAKQSITVAAGGQAYVTWDVRVNDDAARVDLTAQAVSGAYTDSSKPALGTLTGQGIPVYSYGALETVGTSGVLSSAGSTTEGIKLPPSNYLDAHLSVNISPSLAASLQEGLTYLKDYPYLCMEQTVSTFLPNVVTTRALKLAGVSEPSLQADLDQQVSTALQRIYAKQLSDGGWNWWDGPTSDPQTSAYVVLGLLEAKESGYAVSQTVLDNGIKYVKLNLPNIYVNAPTYQFNRYAFMLYVLGRGNALEAGKTNVIYNQRHSLSLFGEAYLAQALYMLDPTDTRIQSLMSDLAGAAVLSASGAHWEEKNYNDYWSWNTDTRTTAIVLNALVQIDPKNPMTSNAVRWLMVHRESGHWHSTQETAWSLIALTNWLTASKEYESDYSFALGLNGTMMKQGQITKANLTDPVKLTVANADLLKAVTNYLVFTRGPGNGNLYYDAYLTTTLPVESIQPLDQGASLARQYFTLNDPKTPITEIQRGQLVRVRLTIVVPAELHYVVIDDPLPAGLEAIDSTIMTDTQVPSKYTVQDYDERGWGWWYFDHVEKRDEKVVLSADDLPAGTYVYTYLARASSVGTFKVIPPTAAEFYFPDVGGRGAGGEFVVKP
ncbi:MAG TPA: Ig-like domain-containing protein [Anaerolineales bacterium]